MHFHIMRCACRVGCFIVAMKRKTKLQYPLNIDLKNVRFLHQTVQSRSHLRPQEEPRSLLLKLISGAAWLGVHMYHANKSSQVSRFLIRGYQQKAQQLPVVFRSQSKVCVVSPVQHLLQHIRTPINKVKRASQTVSLQLELAIYSNPNTSTTDTIFLGARRSNQNPADQYKDSTFKTKGN